MLQSIRILITMTMFMGIMLAPAICIALLNAPQSANPAFFIAGIAMMTPTI